MYLQLVSAKQKDKWMSAIDESDKALENSSNSKKLVTKKSVPKVLTALGLTSISIYSFACVGLWFGQTRFIFKPTHTVTTTPAEAYKLTFQDLYLPVKLENGSIEKIHGWWIPSANKDAQVLLYLHGNGKNMQANLEHANRLHKLGFSILMIDYRGYGLSDGGFPSESGVYIDAQTAWDYLTQQQQINPKQIVIYGHSLGGAIAIDLASKHPDAAGLIVESSFTSMRDMVYRDPKFSIFPVDLLLNQKFDSIHKVTTLKMPVLYIHGTEDELIPASMSQQLFDTTLTSKQLLLIPNGKHNNNAVVGGSVYLQAVQNFAQKVKT
ncbi:alpha/beta fold hydrolase [Tumidithrix elongata RA019]|uniref:Alpha/beta fold hydrolase n=2 Tax=Tumidithrix TaxID=3088355 RepID=A0AAW9PZ55_9CYAN|nr:alpha/beta fold hydrolase [Tumidithrix elongata RA019]